jgi:SanA protein
MLIKTLKMFLRAALLLIGSAVLVLGLARLIAVVYARPLTHGLVDIPVARVAIVLGAGLQRDGTPSPVLRDRVAAATELYFAGKVEKLLLSGDNRFLNYNEPGAMRNYALSLGVPDNALVLDYAGRRTYDTCYRARAIFGVDKAIVVTQGFHLPRALFLCNALGVKASGFSADRREYNRVSSLYWDMRELPATLVALWEAKITHPLPVLGDPEPIFPTAETIIQEQ